MAVLDTSGYPLWTALASREHDDLLGRRTLALIII